MSSEPEVSVHRSETQEWKTTGRTIIIEVVGFNSPTDQQAIEP